MTNNMNLKDMVASLQSKVAVAQKAWEVLEEQASDIQQRQDELENSPKEWTEEMDAMFDALEVKKEKLMDGMAYAQARIKALEEALNPLENWLIRYSQF